MKHSYCLFTWEFFPLPSINNYSLSQGPAIIAPLNDKLLHSPGLSTNSLIDRGCADISSSDILWMPLCIIHRSLFLQCKVSWMNVYIVPIEVFFLSSHDKTKNNRIIQSIFCLVWYCNMSLWNRIDWIWWNRVIFL